MYKLTSFFESESTISPQHASTVNHLANNFFRKCLRVNIERVVFKLVKFVRIVNIVDPLWMGLNDFDLKILVIYINPSKFLIIVIGGQSTITNTNGCEDGPPTFFVSYLKIMTCTF